MVCLLVDYLLMLLFFILLFCLTYLMLIKLELLLGLYKPLSLPMPHFQQIVLFTHYVLCQ